MAVEVARNEDGEEHDRRGGQVATYEDDGSFTAEDVANACGIKV